MDQEQTRENEIDQATVQSTVGSAEASSIGECQQNSEGEDSQSQAEAEAEASSNEESETKHDSEYSDNESQADSESSYQPSHSGNDHDDDEEEITGAAKEIATAQSALQEAGLVRFYRNPAGSNRGQTESSGSFFFARNHKIVL